MKRLSNITTELATWIGVFVALNALMIGAVSFVAWENLFADPEIPTVFRAAIAGGAICGSIKAGALELARKLESKS